MGLASSQARLLNLTTRMHQIEYGAQRLEAMKLQMANESRQVYLEYSEALEQTKVQIKTLTTDGAATYVDIDSLDEMNKAGFTLVVHDVPVDANGNVIEYNASTTTAPHHYADIVINPESGTTFNDELKKVIDAKYATQAGGELTVGNGAQFEKLLTNLMNMGAVTIIQKKPDGSYPKITDVDFADYQSSVATNTSFQEVTDETGLRKAEAKYEADMRRIDMKERKYDYDLAALEEERNAIKQEIETLKTVAKDNVERTFKLFS